MDVERIEFKHTAHASFDSEIGERVTHTKALPWLSVVQSVVGSYDISLGGGKMHSTGEGGFFIAPAGVWQTIVHNRDVSGRMHCRWLFLDVTVNGIYPFDSLYKFPVLLPDGYKQQMNDIFDRIFAAEDSLIIHSLYCEALSLLRRAAITPKGTELSILQKTAEYIKNNYASNITVDELASNVNMSASNFHSVFKKQSGTSPIAYANGFRLSLASELLIQTDTPIAQIAADVGIPDSLYFSKLFKKAHGTTPSQ
jgi:AraC-like DNA-binding protein